MPVSVLVAVVVTGLGLRFPAVFVFVRMVMR